MMPPKVSVIIPTYNEERYISKCLDSLLAQDYENLEIIVVDDGSKDRTAEIVERYTKNNKVRLIRQEHNGPGAARNRGAHAATGELIVIGDGDIIYDRNYVRELVKPIISGEVIATNHGNVYVANSDKIIPLCWGPVLLKYETLSSPNSKMFRAIKKDIFLNAGGYDSSKGYYDDDTYERTKIIARYIPTAFGYHHNPEGIIESFKKAFWMGQKAPDALYLLNFVVVSVFFILIVVVYSFKLFAALITLWLVFISYLSFRKVMQAKKYTSIPYTKAIKLFFFNPFFRLLIAIGVLSGLVVESMKRVRR